MILWYYNLALIEIGAGKGHWQRALLERHPNCDIVSYDNGENKYWLNDRSNVLQGDESVLINNSNRNLFLCYPPGNGSDMVKFNIIFDFKLD